MLLHSLLVAQHLLPKMSAVTQENLVDTGYYPYTLNNCFTVKTPLAHNCIYS